MMWQLFCGITLSCIGSLVSLRVSALKLGRALRFPAARVPWSNDLTARCIQSKQKVSSLHTHCFDLVAARNRECLLDSGSERVPMVLDLCFPFSFHPSSSFNQSLSSLRLLFFVNTTSFLSFRRSIIFFSNFFCYSDPVFPFYISHLQRPRSATVALQIRRTRLAQRRSSTSYRLGGSRTLLFWKCCNDRRRQGQTRSRCPVRHPGHRRKRPVSTLTTTPLSTISLWLNSPPAAKPTTTRLPMTNS
jgi:hypothetical protein